MHFKIFSATARSDDKDLCRSCRESHIFRTDAGKETVLCEAVYSTPFQILGKVTQCNRYKDANTPSLHDMKNTAWVLRTNSSGLAMGFIQNKEYRSKHGDDELDNL